MAIRKRTKASGFTLLEMLLVLTIIGIMVALGLGYYQQRLLATRVDRTASQMQQILNAALSYYVNNGMWPSSLACLQGDTSNDTTCTQQYLPTTIVSPFGSPYDVTTATISSNAGTGGTSGGTSGGTITTGQSPNFYVYTQITSETNTGASTIANVIAGYLPLGYISDDATQGFPPKATQQCTSTTCYVVAGVNIPGQNLNNAMAVNFAGVYHHGGCVPVPQCPVDSQGNQMTPEIIVVPVSLSGLSTSGSSKVYPISSFTAYATSDNASGPPEGTSPPACNTTSQASTVPSTDCTQETDGNSANVSAYWRVCANIVTEQGDIQTTNTSTGASSWGQYVTLGAFTRCAPKDEPSGSSFSVFGN